MSPAAGLDTYQDMVGKNKAPHPTINMSVLPSLTPGLNNPLMSSGGIAEPTFHVTM